MAATRAAAGPAERLPADPWDDSFAPAKRDTDQVRREARGRDDAYAAAYRSGQTGRPLPDDASDAEREAHTFGRQDAANPAATAPAPARSPRRAGAGRRPAASRPQTLRRRVLGPQGGTIRVSGGGAGLFLGVLAYAVASSWLRYGWPGVTGWFSAKFFNQVTLGAAPAGPGLPANGLPQLDWAQLGNLSHENLTGVAGLQVPTAPVGPVANVDYAGLPYVNYAGDGNLNLSGLSHLPAAG